MPSDFQGGTTPGSQVDSTFPPPADVEAAHSSWFLRMHPGWSRLPIATESLQQHMSSSPTVPLMLPPGVFALCHKTQAPAPFGGNKLPQIGSPIDNNSNYNNNQAGGINMNVSPSSPTIEEMAVSPVNGLIGQEPSLSIYATDINNSNKTTQRRNSQPLPGIPVPVSSFAPALPASMVPLKSAETTTTAVVGTLPEAIHPNTNTPNDHPPATVPALERSLTHRLSTGSLDFAAIFGGNFPLPMSHPQGGGGWDGFPAVPHPNLLARMLSSIPGGSVLSGAGGSLNIGNILDTLDITSAGGGGTNGGGNLTTGDKEEGKGRVDGGSGNAEKGSQNVGLQLAPLLPQLSGMRESQSPSEMLDSLWAELQEGKHY